MEKEENITFSGKEAEQLSIKELEICYRLLEAGGEPVISKIIENLTEEKEKLLFNQFPKKEFESKDILYGLPVLRKKYVPLDELWFVDKNGRPIRRFKF